MLRKGRSGEECIHVAVGESEETREGRRGGEMQGSRYIFKPGCQYRIPTGQFPQFPPNHY